MKNSQKGFIVPLLISIIVAALVIGSGAYYFSKKNSQRKETSTANVLFATAPVFCFTFNTNLVVGNKGEEVGFLQTVLSKEGFNISKKESAITSSIYGTSTQAAVAALKVKLLGKGTYAGGFNDAIRTKVNQKYGCKTVDQNPNLGTISIRVIVANIDEVGNKYGWLGIKFTNEKLTEVEQSLQIFNAFVKQSSYGKAQLQWKISGVYELGRGVCDHATYGEKQDDLTQRALQVADTDIPFQDYSNFIIVNPKPDCPDGETWTMEGTMFKAYSLNGRIVHLRGIRNIPKLLDEYVIHEFGHTLAYKPNTGISHPDYLNCPVTYSGGETRIALSSTCPWIFDPYTGKTPAFTVMSKMVTLSDYNAIEKEIIGWLLASDIITTTAGKYNLSPIEQIGPAPKVLKIPITATQYTVYISFRQPAGYMYPATFANKPNGVILEITKKGIGNNGEYLVTNNTNLDAPLKIGVSYRIGTSSVVRVNSINNNIASITVSTGTASLSTITTTKIPCLKGTGPLQQGQTYCNSSTSSTSALKIPVQIIKSTTSVAIQILSPSVTSTPKVTSVPIPTPTVIPTPAFCHTFNTNLTLGIVGQGTEIRFLQKVLAEEGFSVKLAESNVSPRVYGASTQAAVVALKTKFLGSSATAYSGGFNSAIRTAVNAKYSCKTSSFISTASDVLANVTQATGSFISILTSFVTRW